MYCLFLHCYYRQQHIALASWMCAYNKFNFYGLTFSYRILIKSSLIINIYFSSWYCWSVGLSPRKINLNYFYYHSLFRFDNNWKIFSFRWGKIFSYLLFSSVIFVCSVFNDWFILYLHWNFLGSSNLSLLGCSFEEMPTNNFVESRYLFFHLVLSYSFCLADNYNMVPQIFIML